MLFYLPVVPYYVVSKDEYECDETRVYSNPGKKTPNCVLLCKVSK